MSATGGDWLDKEYQSDLRNFPKEWSLAEADGAFNGVTLDPGLSSTIRNSKTGVNLTAKSFGLLDAVSPQYKWTIVPSSGAGTLRATVDPARRTFIPSGRVGQVRITVTNSALPSNTSIKNRSATAIIDVKPTLPAKPAKVVAAPGLRLAEVTTTYGDTGGAPITKVQIRRTGTTGIWTYTAPADRKVTFTGLPGATNLSLDVRVANRAGWSPWTTSNLVRIIGPTVLGGEPSTVFATDYGHANRFDREGDLLLYDKRDPTLRSLKSGEEMVVPAHEGAWGDRAFDLSADGTRIAYAADPVGIYVHNVASGATARVLTSQAACPTNGGTTYSIAAANDGTIAYQCARSGFSDWYVLRAGAAYPTYVGTSGKDQRDGRSDKPVGLSDDGSVFAFITSADYAIDDATNNNRNSLVSLTKYEVATGAIASTKIGVFAWWENVYADLSEDGTRVVTHVSQGTPNRTVFGVFDLTTTAPKRIYAGVLPIGSLKDEAALNRSNTLAAFAIGAQSIALVDLKAGWITTSTTACGEDSYGHYLRSGLVFNGNAVEYSCVADDGSEWRSIPLKQQK
ncbi:hypothetical protein E8D34_06160 [Nocardioides sp. GY 10113]|nr:hypothetical protein E8D34_06160 [Nocardioides sp. GY 10113]